MVSLYPHDLTLVDLFHTYEPPDLQTSSAQTTDGAAATGSTRAPSTAADTVFGQLPTGQLHVSFGANIIHDLDQLLQQSWHDDARTKVIGAGWDMLIASNVHYAATNKLRGEVVDLSGVFTHMLFSPVNLVASRGLNVLKPEAYPPQGLKAMYGSSVGVTSIRGADAYVTLRPEGESLRQSQNTVVIEKKGPDKVTLVVLLDGTRVTAEHGGFTITKLGDGVYSADERVNPSFRDAVIQVRCFSPHAIDVPSARLSNTWTIAVSQWVS